MQSKKTTFTILIIIFMVDPLILAAAARILSGYGLFPAEPFSGLGTLRMVFIGLSIILLLTPWFLLKYFRHDDLSEERLSASESPMTYYIVGAALITVPAVLGFVLVFLGAPVVEIYYFAGATFVGEAAWALDRMRGRTG
jgi:hypothetical protein